MLPIDDEEIILLACLLVKMESTMVEVEVATS